MSHIALQEDTVTFSLSLSVSMFCGFSNSFQFNGIYLNGKKSYVLLKFLLNIYLKWEYSNVVLV